MSVPSKHEDILPKKREMETLNNKKQRYYVVKS